MKMKLLDAHIEKAYPFWMEPTWPKKRTSFHALVDFDWEGPMFALILAAIGFLVPLFETGANATQATPQAVVTNSVPPSSTNTVASPKVAAKTAIITNVTARITIMLFCGICFLLMMCSLAYKAHIKRTYNPTWEIHFEEEFEKDYMTEARSRAAGVLLQYGKLKDWSKIKNKGQLEPVLDFFDNLGFYLYGKQISDRLLHQGFCHYLLIYCQEGFSYIQERQKVEKSTWEYIENLANEVFQVECAKQGCSLLGVKLDPERYAKYLLEELGQDEVYCKEFKQSNPDLVKGLPN